MTKHKLVGSYKTQQQDSNLYKIKKNINFGEHYIYLLVLFSAEKQHACVFGGLLRVGFFFIHDKK